MQRNPVASQRRKPVKVIVEADGGSRGNPGPAGYGSVVWTADRSTVLAESKQAIGQATNNVAEYRGLIAGLEEAAKLQRHRSRGVDGLQTGRRADVGTLEGQASRPRRAQRPGARAGVAVRPRQLHVDSASREFARRPVGQRGDGRRGRDRPTRHRRRPASARARRRRDGPARVAPPPGCCCCATARPSCRCSGATRAAATRR